MRRWLIGLLGLVVVVTHGGDRTPPSFFPPAVNLADLAATARVSDRQGVLLLFEINGCGSCAAFKQKLLAHADGRRYLETHFASATVVVDSATPLGDWRGEPTNGVLLAQTYRVIAAPTLLFFDTDGQVLTRRGGITDVQEFLLLVRYVSEQAYQDLPFTAYRQQHAP
jgi:thioredoxin-related protein